MGRGSTPPSQAALAALDLQRSVPKAKIVYASATAATEVSNMGYAERCGLWGPGTAFPDKINFIGEITKGGVAAMELIARDMKQLGMLAARSLSFRGVHYDRLLHELTDEQIEIYDTLARAWQVTLHNFKAALEVTGGSDDPRAKGAAMSAFWGSHLRFFNTIVTAMQMPSVMRDIELEIAAGNACVLQIVNTNEAAQERALAKLDEDDDLSDLDMTPRDQLIQLVEHCFPTTQYETYLDEAGNQRTRPVTDSKGNMVKSKEAEALRDALLIKLANIRVPDGPLEMLFNKFGTANIAEVTGRKQRIVRRVVDGVEKTVREAWSPVKARADVASFMADKKRILVFSDAGGTGASYHASTKVANQRRRIHYLVQAGWVADQAIQGFGRTHRTHQRQPPLYKLVSTDLKGQKRFISTIARRLDQLGALTKGQRQTATQGLFKAADNLESTHAREALYQLYRDLNSDRVEGMSMAEFERQTGLSLLDKEGNLKKDLPPVSQFLNRILSMTVATQNRVFDMYERRIEQKIQHAIDEGTLDVGVETVTADSVQKVSERVLFTEPSTGAQTLLVELKLLDRNQPHTFDEIMEGRRATQNRKVEFFATNRQSGRTYAFCLGSDRTTDDGSIVSTYRQVSPLLNHAVSQVEIKQGANWAVVDDPEKCRSLWDAEVAAVPEFREERMWLAQGVLLPVYDRLPSDWPKVRRIRDDDGVWHLGRVIPEDHLYETLRKFGCDVDKAEFSVDRVVAKLTEGSHKAELSNGWVLKWRRQAGERRLELVGPQYMHHQELQLAGLIIERGSDWVYRFYLPGHPDKLKAVVERLVQRSEVVSLARAA